MRRSINNARRVALCVTRYWWRQAKRAARGAVALICFAAWLGYSRSLVWCLLKLAAWLTAAAKAMEG